MSLAQTLQIDDLRARCLKHSRAAYRLLPPLDRPRILDIGCGQGLQTLELARLSQGRVIGMDIDRAAISSLQERINEAGLGDRVTTLNASLLDNRLDDASFDLLWEEGVLHLLSPAASLAECRRLLRPGGHLVMHETVVWFKSVRGTLSTHGLELIDQHLLPKHYWWTDYGAPLDERVKAYKAAHPEAAGSASLREHERVVASIRKDPDRSDCGFYLLQRCG